MADQFKFAEAFTELTVRDSQFHSSIRKATFSLQKLQRNLEAVAKHARRMLLVGGAALAGFIKLASDAEETASKFNAVFKDGADEARAWADALAKAVGRSSFAIQESLSSFQSFFIGLGFGADAAVEMSKRMQKLSIDFASFNNISDAEAAKRFISALSGSSEVLDMYGINIKAAALETELLNMGIGKSAAQANEMEKSLARVAIIAKAMGQQGAIGDAVRTAGSLANQFKATVAEAKALAIEIGTAFIPVMQRAVKVIRSWGESISDLVKGNEDAIVSITLFTGALLVIVSIAPKVVGALMLIGKAATLLGGGVAAGGLIGLLAVSVAALGAAWASASLQGKDFGDTVLEIADAMGLLTQKTKEAVDAAKGDPLAGDPERARRIAIADAEAQAKAAQVDETGKEDPVVRGLRDKTGVARARHRQAVLARIQAENEKVVAEAAQRETNKRLGPLKGISPLNELLGFGPGIDEDNAVRAANQRLLDARQREVVTRNRAEELGQQLGAASIEANVRLAAKEGAAERKAAEDLAKINREREKEEERFGRDQMFDRRLAEEEEAAAIQRLNRQREAEERGFGAQQEEAATAQARRLGRRQPGQVAQMGVAAVQGFVQSLLNQPPRPEDVERNTLLKAIARGPGEIVEAIKAQPGAAFQ